MNGATVTQLWRYPVKSMAGECLPDVAVRTDGVVGDRAFAVVDARTGGILTAKRVSRLLDAAARWLGGGTATGHAELTLPGIGAPVRTDDPDASRLLSAWLGRPVRLERPGGRAGRVEYETDPDDPTALSTFDLPARTFVDDSPLHILTEDALRMAETWYPDGAWRVPRFRPNVVLGGVETGCRDVPVEDGWVGRRLALGAVPVSVTGRCERCVMVTRANGGLARDPEILRTLIRRHGATLGVYGRALSAGVVSIGDAARPHSQEMERI